ncbi:MAG TPA: urease accessory protein UreE [Alphaproteobacteria bacterium]|nr:urease accessory protein UreE [Alphaproteobacteria bacterium]
MLRATAIRAAGTWAESEAADRLRLTHADRHRRRFRYTAAGGTDLLLDLPQAVVLRHGDALVLEDGRLVLVEAAPESLLDVTAPDAATLLRLAWHIGNRHLPAELAGDRIRIRNDHVIAAMLRGLGATVRLVEAPFDPEGGAYAGGHHH